MQENFLNIEFDSAGRHVARGNSGHATLRTALMEIIYVQRGTLYLFEEDKNFQIMPGERLFLFPDRKHGSSSLYPKGVTFFWMNFRLPQPELTEYFEKIPQLAALSAPNFMDEYVRIILSEQRRYRLDKSPESAANLANFAAIILREALRCPNHPVKMRNNTLIDFARQYIDTHYMIQCETADIARELKCHKDYLSRLYSAICGETIGESVRKKRIEAACAKLEDSSATIKQIAFSCGFNDVSYFRRQFLRECAMTPQAYRLLHRFGYINSDD